MSLASSALARGLRKLATLRGETATAYRLFDIYLLHKIALSPSLCRLVFGGDDIAQMQTLGPDQRVKLFFPAPDGSLPRLPHGAHWGEARRNLPDEQRPPMRTYTLRDLRREAGELDIDFVLHGVNGPASAWATTARPGDRLQIVAPNLAFEGDPGGYEWKPPANARSILLVGDETALPAIAGILEALALRPDPPRVEAYLEVPLQADCLAALPCLPTTELHWLPRDTHARPHGQAMVDAVKHHARLPQPRPKASTKALDDVDIDQQILWELAAPAADEEFYAWIAGESASVMQIRRYLINERGLDRKALTLMGYWRLGRSLE